GKVAVITGAGSGIGRALAVQLANEDCSLALVDISEKGLQHTLAVLNGRRNKITTHVANVADRERMAALPAEIEQAHGAIDLLFNNAGVTINKSFADSSLEDLDFVININLYGVLYGCHYFLPYLKQRPESHIINTSSLAGFLGLPNQASYCLSKAAVKSLSETLRAELAVHNIGVTSIHPGTIRTNILRSAAGKSGDNQQTTEKLANLMERFGMPPQKLAVKVVDAIKHNRMQVRIGWDSFLGDWFKRLFPRGVHKPLQWGFAKELQKKQLAGSGGV
ncbi:MAG TPA: SDR family NAD(P)-dependent oxidoreductase, partial [Dongiaceae bacterium]|nr:SDR family NAD(P)-dependent oxidoreductase [Dongiaceae bacterium]